MIIHLAGGGPDRRDVVTECCLNSAPSGSLTSDIEKTTCPDCRWSLINRGVCPNCESTKLAWGTFPSVTPGISPGRYEARDVTTEFHLGCEECSETLIALVHPNEVAAALTAMGWRPTIGAQR